MEEYVKDELDFPTRTKEQAFWSEFQVWTSKIKELEKVLDGAKKQSEIYAQKILSNQNYFTQQFLKTLMHNLKQNHQVPITLDGSWITKIIEAKWKAISENYFQIEANPPIKGVKFMHPRLGKLFSQLLKDIQPRNNKYSLKKEIITELTTKFQRKNLQKDFIAVQGFMLMGKQEKFKELINTQRICKGERKFIIEYEAMFDEKLIKEHLEQKGFTKAHIEKLMKTVQGRPEYKNVGKPQFKDQIRHSEHENGEYALYILICSLQLEYINQHVKPKENSKYLQNIAITEGLALVRGVILGELAGLSEGGDDDFDEEDAQEVMEQFNNYFDGLFNKGCEETDLLLKICRGVAKKIETSKKSFAEVIKDEWKKSR